MALINCPNCGKEISDKATSCIHCGAPLIETEQPISHQPTLNTTIESETPPPHYLLFSSINTCLLIIVGFILGSYAIMFYSLIVGLPLQFLSMTVKKMWADGNVENARKRSKLVHILNIIVLIFGIILIVFTLTAFM